MAIAKYEQSLIQNQTIKHKSPPTPRVRTTAPLSTSLHLYCVCSIPRGLTANKPCGSTLFEYFTTTQSMSVYPLAVIK